ncbi:MAG TPA: alkaline phosphatase family protein [Bacteroidota bacterium]|nr:alkaline phosphatase family protein [Bacteroidota bacterium]
MSSPATHLLFLFLDGVGIGHKLHNPFFEARIPVLQSLLGGKMAELHDCHRSDSHASLVPLNATLGVDGLPQSGTGQSALLTGQNTSRIIGRHFGPYTYSSLKPVVENENIFLQLVRRGKKVCYANAFPRRYFDYIHSPRARMTPIAYSWFSTGMQFNGAEELRKGRALSADITNERWPDLGYPDIAPISSEQAGRRLARLLRKNDLVFFEYFQTDHAGHHQSMAEAVSCLERIDELLGGFLDEADGSEMTALVTSDHGNMEDLSVKTHTRNPVPLLAFGAHHHVLTAGAKNLTHVSRGILKLLT